MPDPLFAVCPAASTARSRQRSAPGRCASRLSYRFRAGKFNWVFTQTLVLGVASGFSFSQTSMKFGYDMGAFKPYVSAAFSEVKAPAFGANVFAAPPDAATPFAYASSATSVGAGFDYAITDKLSFGMSVNASQFSGWRR